MFKEKGIVYLLNTKSFDLVFNNKKSKNKTQKLMACAKTKDRSFSTPYYS